MDLSVLIFYGNGILHYVTLCAKLPSPSVMFWGFTTMCRVPVLHFCLWLNITLSVYTTKRVSTHLSTDIWAISIFWLLWIALLWTCRYMHLFAYPLSFLLGIYPGVEFLGHKVILCFTFWGTPGVGFIQDSLLCFKITCGIKGFHTKMCISKHMTCKTRGSFLSRLWKHKFPIIFIIFVW